MSEYAQTEQDSLTRRGFAPQLSLPSLPKTEYDCPSAIKPLVMVGCPSMTLLKMLAEHRTGCLIFKDLNDLSVSWIVYLDQGKIVFAESCCGQRERLLYLLKSSIPQFDYRPSPEPVRSIYSLLCQIWSENNFPTPRLQEILAQSTQEALVQVFAMRKCEMVYDPSKYFPPVIKSSSFSALIDPVEPWISQWRGIRNEIKSPFQRVFIRDWDTFFNMISYARSCYQQLHQLNLGLGKNLTLYQLASHLHMSVRELAVMLHPLIKAGAVGVRAYREVRSLQRPLVASLNQKSFSQQLTQRTLERSGFDVLTLRNPHQFVQQLQVSKPAIALLDSDLSQANAFDLCRQVRQIPTLEDLPIVLLLKEKQFFGQKRSQWAGATDVLKNPIRPQELVRCVRKWKRDH